MKIFQAPNQIKDRLSHLYLITKEKFQVQKQEVILEYSEEEYEAKFRQHKCANRLDDMDLCIEDFNKEYF